jgi:hypothetical protein
MPDNWSFVAAAYALTAVVLGMYWRHLVRKENEVRRSATTTTTGPDRDRDVAGTAAPHTNRAHESSADTRQIAERSREPSRTGHPRGEPSSRQPLP